MTSLARRLRNLLERGQPAVLATLTKASGSTPREAGACMLITQESAVGTIGGGRLEWLAIEEARAMIADGGSEALQEVSLGPSVGQCCGGKVEISFRLANREILRELEAVELQQDCRRPRVMVFGAGHVGVQLGRALSLLPFETTLVDDRAELLEGLPAELRLLPSADPIAELHSAPLAAAAVVLTYSHSLDFEITEAALLRGDMPYVGMIGSKTKRTKFERWFLSRGGTRAALASLVCPIGGTQVKDKRPEVIASLVAAELVTAFWSRGETRLSGKSENSAITAIGGKR